MSTTNKNLRKYAKVAAALRAKLKSRLPRKAEKQFAATTRRLWWRYRAYRTGSPKDNANAWDVLARMDAKKTIQDINGNPIETYRFILASEGQELNRLVVELKPKLSIEVGLAHGFSTLSILQGLSDKGCGKLISIDPFQLLEDYRGVGLMNVRSAGLDGFHLFMEQTSESALPDLYSKGVRVDFGFIDGNHLFDYTLLEFFYLNRMLKKGGCLGFHDYRFPAVRACLNFIEANYPYTVRPTAEPNLRILIKEEEDTRPWFYSIPFDVPKIAWTTLEDRQFCS